MCEAHSSHFHSWIHSIFNQTGFKQIKLIKLNGSLEILSAAVLINPQSSSSPFVLEEPMTHYAYYTDNLVILKTGFF